MGTDSQSRLTIAACLTALLGLLTGCGGTIGPGTGIGPGPTDGLPPPGNGTNLSVTLSVSNPTPRPNEQVTLTCRLTNAGDGNLTFDFQPAGGRLVVNHAAGTAGFIVQESDVGVAMTFTCTASDGGGTSPPSDPRTIIPSS
jgi:hypothetical protein